MRLWVLITVLLPDFSISVSNGTGCLTQDNVTCQFPFSFAAPDGTVHTFHSCPWDKKYQGFICSTKVDENGMHIKGNVGNCSRTSPECKFDCGIAGRYCESEEKCVGYELPCDGKCMGQSHSFFIPPQILGCDGKCKFRKHEFPEVPKQWLCGETCQSEEEPCNGECPAGGECIVRNSTCNGQCPQDFFKCSSSPDFCVPVSHVCNKYFSDWHCPSKEEYSKEICQKNFGALQCLSPNIHCSGSRPGQCISPASLCNGKYDCVDRSDEANCSIHQADGAPSVPKGSELSILASEAFQECTDVTTGRKGLRCNQQCIPYYEWCVDEPSDHMEIVLKNDCPEMVNALRDRHFCGNRTFWEGRECNLAGWRRCDGNSMGACVSEKCQCNDYCMRSRYCPDMSHMVCNSSANVLQAQKCSQNEDMYKCEGGEICIEDVLLCDGYTHCPNGDDESETICASCPRERGFPGKQKVPLATYPCKHKYTNRWICAIPCDGEEDWCADNEDERNCSIDTTFLIIIFGTCLVALHCGYLLWWIYISESRQDKEKVIEQEETLVHKILAYMSRDSALTEQDIHEIAELYKQEDEEENRKRLLTASKVLPLEREALLLKTVYFIEYEQANENLIKFELNWLTKMENSALMLSIRDAVQPGIGAKLKKLLPQAIAQSQPLIAGVILLQTVNQLVAYYVDFFKDLALLLAIARLLTAQSSMSLTLVCTIFAVSLCSMLFKEGFNLFTIWQTKQLTKNSKIFLSAILPLAPGIAYLMTGRYQIKEKRALNPKHYPGQLLQALERSQSVQRHVKPWKSLSSDFQKNEAFLEHFVQGMLLMIVTLLHLTKTRTTSGIEHVFIDDPSIEGTILILSAAVSFKSCITGQLKYFLHRKNNNVKTAGKALLALLIALCTLTKVAGIILFLAPGLGLFDLLKHWKYGLIPATSSLEAVYDIGAQSNDTAGIRWLKDVWVSDDHPTWYSVAAPGVYLMTLVILSVSHLIMLSSVKKTLSPAYAKCHSKAQRLLHLLGSLITPLPFKDWEESLLEDSEENFDQHWSQARNEIKWQILLSTFFNWVFGLPVVVLACKISVRNNYLGSQGLEQLPEEVESTQRSFLLACGAPLLFTLLGLLQWILVKLYYYHGHPWAVLAKSFLGIRQNLAEVSLDSLGIVVAEKPVDDEEDPEKKLS